MRTHCGWVAVVLLAVTGCGSPAEQVCEGIGNCSQSGSADWIQQCSDEAHQLQKEASSAGCAVEFDRYFACANNRYDCVGNKATFVGCEADHAAFDRCLGSARDSTSCGELESRLSSCSDGGTVVRPACTSLRACQARCLLDQVAEVCAPRLGELDLFTACAKSCPP